MSPDYAFWESAYSHGWATKTQLQEAVELGVITADEYYQITGETYVAA